MRCLPCRRFHQWDRKTGGEWTKAGIDNIGLAADRHGQEHMVALRVSQRPKQNDPRGMTGELKTERLKHSGEKGGVLKTITAAAGLDDLRLKTIEIETHRSTEQYVQVLKGDMRRMGLDQPCQCFKRRVAATGPTNAVELGVEVDGGDHVCHPVDCVPMV